MSAEILTVRWYEVDADGFLIHEAQGIYFDGRTKAEVLSGLRRSARAIGRTIADADVDPRPPGRPPAP